MSVEDDDTQSFYSLLPESWEDDDRDWSEAGTYHLHAQLNLLSLPVTASTYSPLPLPSAAHQETTRQRDATPVLHLPTPVPALAVGERSAVVLRRHPAPANAHQQRHTRSCDNDTSHPSTRTRASTSAATHDSARRHAELNCDASAPGRKTRGHTLPSSSSSPAQPHLHPASSLEGGAQGRKMDRTEEARSGDLFLELANDQSADTLRPTSHGEPLQGRQSFSNKRRSLPADAGGQRRPQSSGHVFSRLVTPRMDKSSDLPRHAERYRNSLGGAKVQADDAASVSSASRSGVLYPSTSYTEHRSSLLNGQMNSPDLPQFGRRRPSFGASPRQLHKPRPMQVSNQFHDSYESQPENSEPKPSLPDSASVDSQTADTVWDELDDLKSRIKKLELTGKLPQTSSAALTTEQSERPRTATTAPTTIDSSPKHDKSEPQHKKAEPQPGPASPEVPAEYVVGGPDAANIHPNLHAALARAKSLLNPALFRTLEATAADALQLAAMTGSAGPQGTALTAAAIINGVTVSDRHVRRKADTMCRNLTDLVLALCDGKSEATTFVSSPVTFETPATKRSPSLRYSRSSLGPNDGLARTASRPMSRLEARRTSILGSQAGSSIANSPLESGGEDVSASEHGSAASYPRLQLDSRRLGRTTSRLQVARARHFNEAGEDEDPTVRPISRAATDIIGRAKPASGKDYSTPQRSPSFREAMAARRSSQEGHAQLSREVSMTSDSGSRRHFLDPNTPPVLEEEGGAREDLQSASQSKRRIASFGPWSSSSSRRSAAPEGGVPHRAASLYQRRHVMVE